MLSIIDLDKFKEVAPQMLWREAALEQIDAFEKAIVALAKRIHVTAEVVGSHSSKSIDLPVVKISTEVGEFILRNNFHDINLMAILKSPSTLSLEQLFAGIQEPLTWEWYLAEIERARGYSWREWSDEEMNDPRILRVRDKRPGCDMWWEKKGAEKDRWAARMSSPAWYSQDWSNCEFTWDGDFGPGVKLFRQDYAYAEGIKATTSNRKYLKGVSDFIIATNTLAAAITMIERFHIVSQHHRVG
jgi:hypothetical protein